MAASAVAAALPMPEVPPVIRTTLPSIPPVELSTILLTKASYGVRIPPLTGVRGERTNNGRANRARGAPSWILEYWPRTARGREERRTGDELIERARILHTSAFAPEQRG
jgi:hypothetical protein